MASAGRDDRSPEATGRLDERVLETLASMPGTVAFSGLRRALRAHPESLSRSLRRLEREGLVERADGGYRLLSLPTPDFSPPRDDLRTIGEVALLPGVNVSELRGRLAGRWFGSLRWVGTLERGERTYLMWSLRDAPGQLLLSVEPGRLKVLSPVRDEAPEATEVEEAGYELLLHVLEDLRPSPALRSRTAVLLHALPAPPVPFAA